MSYNYLDAAEIAEQDASDASWRYVPAEGDMVWVDGHGDAKVLQVPLDGARGDLQVYLIGSVTPYLWCSLADIDPR